MSQLGLMFENVSLFKREEQIERVLRLLEFPQLVPGTFLLVGSPATAKTRFLISFSGLFHGQQLPVAIVTCPPDRQNVPFSLVIALLTKFLVTYSPARIEQWVGPTLASNPWLAWLFRTLTVKGGAPVPPEDSATICHGLEAMLMGIIREAPHLGVVLNMHQADPESLLLLQTVQTRSRHGLRVLATTELDAQGKPPAALQPLQDLGTTFELPTVSAEECVSYLEEIAEELAVTEIAEHLHAASHGLLLAMERTVRAWAMDGTLTFDGETWTYHAPEDPAAHAAFQEPILYDRLGQLALLGTTSIAVLALLWGLPQELTEDIVERGRRLGHLRPAHPETPDIVEVCDLDQQAYLSHHLTPEQRQEMHRRIVELFENAAARQAQPGYDHFPLAFHMEQAGLTDEARAYLRAQQRSLQTLLEETQEEDPATPEFPGLQRWDLPPPDEVTDDVADLIVKTSTALRLAGVQYQLYPLHCQPVRERTKQAMTTLDRLFSSRPNLIITFDGKTIAFDGISMKRKELAIVTRDYARWMKEGCLHAIGITRGIRHDELGRFLHALVNHEPKSGVVGLLSKIAALNLLHLRIHTGFFSAPVLAETRVEEDQFTDALTHSNIMAFLITGIAPDEARACLDQMGQTGVEDSDREEGADSRHDDFTVTRANWAELAARLERSSAHVRRLLTASALQWFRPHVDDAHAEALPEDYDAVICTRLAHEADEDIIDDLTAFTCGRLEHLLQRQRWPEIIRYYRILTKRHAQDTNPRIHKLLGELLHYLANCDAFTAAFTGLDSSKTTLDTLRTMVELLGVVAIRPLLTRLSLAEHSRERLALVQHLSILCTGYHHLLVQELKTPYPWYYYRNVLIILAAVGTESAIASVSEKIAFPDPRVRMEAISTAVTLVKDRAATYVAHGLTDADVAVRARAAGIAWQCPQPRIRDLLIGQLRNRGLNEQEPADLQMTVCASLGLFADPEARQTLIGVAMSRMLTPYWAKPELVRVAALEALTKHLDDPAVRHVVDQLCRERKPTLRQVAQKIRDAHPLAFAETDAPGESDK